MPALTLIRLRDILTRIGIFNGQRFMPRGPNKAFFISPLPNDAGRGPSSHRFASADDLQTYLLKGVSRTFALTIPQLPVKLYRVVSNAYLLCRIVDTIEDEPALDWSQKQYFSQFFVDVVAGKADTRNFARNLAPRLSDTTIPAEHELIQLTPDIIDITHSMNSPQQNTLRRCIRIMAEGMVEFQQQRSVTGLDNLPHLDRYCYHVAGIVGETLTQLFCDYSDEISLNEAKLMELAVSFGQGLQMTNILKDIWEDHQRGACWLPRDLFTREGFDLSNLVPGKRQSPAFERGLIGLISVARCHLANAVEYTLMMPKYETGIRNFCLWAIAMAVLTLRKLNHHLDFRSGNEVKITRRSVKATLATSRLTAAHNSLVKLIFYCSCTGLPRKLPESATTSKNNRLSCYRR